MGIVRAAVEIMGIIGAVGAIFGDAVEIIE